MRRLTQIDDKLPALSGIAELFKEKSGDVYAAGLWKRSLPFDLLWRCDQSGDLKKEKRRMPSWSWISVDGAIKWPVSQEPELENSLEYITSTTYFEGGAEGVELCDMVCKLDGLNEFGRVKSGTIKLKTKVVPAGIQLVREAQWTELYGTKWAVQVSGSDSAPFWPDINEEGLSAEREHSNVLYVMEVMKQGNGSWSWEEGLVVRLRQGSETEYERVGVAANIVLTATRSLITRRSWFHDLGYGEVMLV